MLPSTALYGVNTFSVVPFPTSPIELLPQAYKPVSVRTCTIKPLVITSFMLPSIPSTLCGVNTFSVVPVPT